ncbi:RNase A-like domain-containing protein, partial [Pseudomonas lijiangensis]|uniref:RNase A-like domain-containing protein n=1 Tax=Pseudomonas lijiangensis TaxID=2995658 RepID=UPI003CCEC1C4
PVLDSNGGLVRFNVQNGSVAIEGLGLNADNVDQFDIITRSAKLNAELHAKKLNIIAGRNDVDAQTLSATALADDGSAKPELAIDSSALGGMYVGAVKLVGTEAGVGVRLASNVAASAGDIQIDANGQLTLSQAVASGAMAVNANAVEVKGPLYAGTSLSVTTPGDLTIEQNVAARDVVTLSSTGQLTNTAIIEAGINPDNSRNTTGDVVLSAGNLTNTGSVVASRALQVTATQSVNNQGATLSGQGSTRVTAKTLDNRQSGRVLSQSGSVNVTANEVLNSQSGLISSAGSLTLSSASLDNSRSGRITGKGVTVTTGAFDNHLDGRLTSTEALRLTAEQVNNSEAGRIASAMALTVVVTGLDQHADGRLYGNGDVSLDLGNGHLNNQDGLITAPGQLLLTRLGTVNNQRGEISSAKGFTLAATSLDNTDGTVLSDQALIVRIDKALTNLRGLVSGTGVELSAGTLSNLSGSVSSEADLTLDITGEFINQKGLLSSAGITILKALSLNNAEGQVMADEVLTIILGQALDNQAGTLGAALGLDIHAASLDNRQVGTVLTDGTLGITLTGTLDNRGGVIRSDDTMTLLIDTLDNSQTGLTAAQKGAITSKAGLTFIGTQLDNQNGLLNAVGVMTLQADTLLNGAGRIASQSDLTAIVDTVTQQGGELVAQGNLTLTGQRLDNRAGGLVGATKALKLTVDDIDNRAGEVSSQVGVELIGERLDNSDGGKVLAGTALQLLVERVINENKGLLFGQTLTLDGKRLDNAGGTLASQLAQTLTLTGALNNRAGLLSSEAALTVKAASLDNTGGTLSSAEALKVTTDDALINQSGSITTDAGLTVVSGSLDNSQKGKLSGQGATTVTTGAFDNRQGGQLTSSDTLELIAGKVINQSAGRIASALALTASVTSLDQQGGELFSNTTLSLDLNNGQLNNQGGLINSPGALLLKNLKGVDNQGGEISSAQAFTLKAQSLDNSGGKLLGSQGLIVRIAEAFTNVKGAVIADGDLEISAASGNNAQGEISSKKNLTAEIGNLQQQGGQLFALGSLSLTGDTLNNRLKGFVGAGEALTLTVEDIDNQGGEISSQKGITLTGQTLTNSGGQVLAQQALTLDVATTTNRNDGVLSGKTGLTLTGASLDNTGGVMSGLQGLSIDLSGALDNSQGLISSGAQMDLTAGELTNHGGSIASQQALVASVSSLEQQKGSLTSATALSLDVNQGLLDNQGGLINAPGTLLLKNLKTVLNQGGEISSAQAFTLNAQSLDNSGGTLLSNQLLTLRIAQALNNVKGMIAAAGVDATAASLDNTGGTLTSRNALDLTVTGLLTNRDKGLINAAETLKITSGDLNNRAGQLLGTTALTLDSAALDTGAKGLINSQGTLNITADSLSADTGGEVSALGTLTLVLNALSLDASRLIGNAGLSLDLNGADLNNRAGLITATGPLTVKQVRDVNNQGGEISSAQSFTLTAQTLDNSGGQLISSDLLTLNADSLLNQNGLISGWQGLDVTATSLDNRNRGTLSSRNGAVDVDLSGALLNSGAGALVSQTALTVTADSLDNRGGILSSGTGQTLTVTGLLNNSQSGLIDSGADLTLTANALDNSAGTLISTGKATLDLIGALTNTGGKLASGGDWLLKRSSAVHNQGGQLISQRLMTLNTGLLDNSTTGTVAANGTLLITATGKVLNHTDGLIYSQNAGVELDATSLDNTRGAVQGQSTLKVETSEGIDNLNGRLIAQNGDLTVEAARLDNRGGLLSSLKGLFTAQISGVLKNGYDLAANRQGGVIQAQRLSLTALGGFDNYGGRVSASTGEALLTTANLDNRNGGIYAKGLVRVIAKDLDNSGDNDGQIAGGQVDLRLTGDLNNRLGIIESDSTLAIKAASLDNQTGQIRSLGTLDAADFQIGTLFDNRRGTVEVANSNLILNAASFLNTNGSLIHAGAGTFDISTANLTQAGGNLVTRGGLTVTADSWTNSSVIQAGRLTVNVGTFNQTASGQLLASSAFVGTGGNWTNEGVIASDGTLSLNLSGGYGGGGRTSSLGTLGLTASQLALTRTASLMGGARTELNITGLASNYGRITSAADLIVNAGSVTNYGTLGATQNLTFNTASLLNSQGLIFSGGDMQANVGSLSNLKGDFYALNNLTIKGYGVERANQVSNISGSMESGGNFAISATAFENRTEGSEGAQASTAGRTLVKGIVGVRCSDCYGYQRFGVDYVVREYFEGAVDTDVTASAMLVSGQDFVFLGGDFLNNKSTISAVGNIVINANNVRNVGAVGGSVVRTRIYYMNEGDGLFVDARYYNQRNNPDFPNVYYLNEKGEFRLGLVGSSYEGANGILYVFDVEDAESAQFVYGVPLWFYRGASNGQFAESLYDRNNLVEVPASVTSAGLISDVEEVLDGGSSGRSAVIQSGGNVSITATQNLQNSVIRQDYVAGGGTSKVQGTSPSGTGTVIIRVNAQLPPDLSQQQVNPLTLPGFSLPTGQNGLFRLSAQTGSNVAATQTSTAPQNWTLGSASVSVAQREQTVSDTQARALQFGTAGQVSTATRQLADVVRQNSGLSANASAFDSSAPVDSATRLQLTGHSAGSTGLTQVADVTLVQGQNGNVPLPGQGATTVPVITPVASNNTTAQNGTATSTAVPSIQVARVQALPGNTAPPNSHKYLIETNPVLTDLRQFMSSDYLLAGLGYDPEASAKRLGDGLYEQRLVQQAIVARTGQAFLAGQTSNEAQLKYLMNNAIASKEQLNLAIGVTLTPPQVAALTHDIVWLEEHEVNGEKVLVPVLYLAQANNRLGPTGALIAGNDVTLTAGEELDNVGTLRATNNLSATAGTNLVNVGLIEAGNRLDLLAGNDLINKAGGILYGRDVTLTATRGDVINERTVIRDQRSTVGVQDFVESAARVESANDLTVKAGRDVMNIGSVLQSGRDLTLIAGRDLNIGAAQTEKARTLSANNTQSSITQLGSSVSVGRDLMALSGRDIYVVASDIDAKRDIAMAATENMTISSAADETHSLSRSKKLTVQTDHVKQVSADLNAGGSIVLNAGQDLAVISSRITAGENANLSAGENLSLLAAQDSDYYLYDKKKKGSFGSKKTKRDEVTDIRNVGSEITSGGDLTLESGGDQLYQVAKLTSGNDLTIESGGGISFEGVKDLHQESHTKSSSSLAWTSMKGKGRTDETLRQTEMVVKGELAIRAVEGLKIDIKQVDQQTVSQTIDAMVQADPQLAWLKEAEKRGDVDWRQVKELHDSFKYSNSSLGQGAMLAIMIIVTVLTAGAASALAASAGSFVGAGSTMAAATAATASTSAAAAGLGNVIATAALTSMAGTAVVGTINNKGNIGAALKETFSSDGLKNAVIAGLTAGITTGVIDPNLSGSAKELNSISKGFDLSTLSGIGGFAVNAGAQGVASGLINTAINGGNLGDNLASGLASQAGNVVAAVGFYQVGSIADEKYWKAYVKGDTQGMAFWTEGGMGRTALHALMGGAVSSATGGDFMTGAVAAGASQAMAGVLKDVLINHPEFREAASKLVGLTAAGVAGGDVDKAVWVAGMADQYNRQLHPLEEKWLKENAKEFADKLNITEQEAMERLSQQALKDVDYLWRARLADGDDSAAKAFLSSSEKTFVNDLGETQALFTTNGQQLFRPEMFADTADRTFYRKFVQSGISRELSSGLIKEIKDSGIDLKDGSIDLLKAAVDNPSVVVSGLWEGIKGLPKSVVDGFWESGNAIGEGAAVALNEDLSDKLNALYDTDVSAAQQALLLIRTVSVVTGAGTLGKTGAKLSGDVAKAVGSKLDEMLEKAVVKNDTGKGTPDLANNNFGSEGPCCFAAGTMVSTPDGDRAIDTLKVGDIVWSKPEKGGKPFAAAILATHVRNDQPIYRLKLKSVRQDGEVENETLLVTPGHPFYVPAQRDFVPVIDLKPGDRLQSLEDGASENTSSEVESLELYLPEGKTYNLTVDVGHTFYVGKLKTWVHNTGPCILPEGYFGGNDTLGPYSPIVDGGGLRAHENAGGHLLDRHVDLTDADLAQRLATSNISSASRFADRATAEAAVSAAVDANQATINSYLSSGTKGYLAIEYSSSIPVGTTLVRGASSTTPASEVRVVIARDSSMSTGYKIITGYPHL